MADVERYHGIPLGARDIFPDGAAWAFVEYDRLQILFLTMAGEEKRRGFAVPNRSAQCALDDAPLLGGAHQGKGVDGVHYRVAKNEIQRSVIIGSGVLGDNFDIAAAGPGKLRRIGILIDAHLLNGRGRDCRAGNFDAVNNELRAICAERSGIEDSRHGSDIVLIEDGHTFQKSLTSITAIAILGRIRGHLHRSRGNRNLRNQLSKRKSDGQGRGWLLLNLGRREGGLKPLLQNLNGVIALRNSFKTKSARGIRLYGRKLFGAAFERDGCVGHRGAAGVEKRPGDCPHAAWVLSPGARVGNQEQNHTPISPQSSPSQSFYRRSSRFDAQREEFLTHRGRERA